MFMHMSIRSERINILVSPEEKADLAAAAETLGVSLSEYLRMSGLHRAPTPEEMEELAVMSELIAGMAERLDAKLDAGLKKLDSTFENIKALRAAAVRAEMERA